MPSHAIGACSVWSCLAYSMLFPRRRSGRATTPTQPKEVALAKEQKMTREDLMAAAEELRDNAVRAGDEEAAERAQQALNEAGKLAGS